METWLSWVIQKSTTCRMNKLKMCKISFKNQGNIYDSLFDLLDITLLVYRSLSLVKLK